MRAAGDQEAAEHHGEENDDAADLKHGYGPVNACARPKGPTRFISINASP